MPHSVTAVGLPASRVDSQATLEYCDGQGRAARLGFDVACPVYAIPSEYNNETRPATSCLEIKEIFPAAPSAPYYLKFSASAPVEKIWCEMEPVVCEFKLWGAGGGGEKGLVGGVHAGSGGFTRGQFKMSIGQEVTVKVGRGGRSADSTDTCVKVMYGDGEVCSETGGAGGGYAGVFAGSEVSPATKILIAGGGGGANNTHSGCAGGGLEGSDAQCNPGGGGVGSLSGGDSKGLGFVHSEVLAGETLGHSASSGASYDNIAEPVKSDEFGYVRGYGAGAGARALRTKSSSTLGEPHFKEFSEHGGNALVHVRCALAPADVDLREGGLDFSDPLVPLIDGGGRGIHFMYSGGDQKFVWDGIVGSARDERPDPSWSSDIEFLTSQSSTNYILTDTNSEWNVGIGDFTLDMTYMPHCGVEDFNGKDGCLCPRFRTDDNAVNGTLIHKTPNGLDGIYVAIGPQTACHSGDAGYAFRFGTSATTYVELSNPYAGNYGIPMKLRFQRKGDELSIYRDGSLEARKTFDVSADDVTTTDNIVVGRIGGDGNDASGVVNAKIKDLAFYSNAMDDAFLL